jgi:hypothetical protein
MKSASDVASKSGGGANCSVVRTVGRPCTSMTCPSSICQSGSSVGAFFHRTFSSTIVRSPTRPCQLAATPATHPAGICHEPRSRSSVVFACSASQTTSSSSTPSASATIATASAKTAVPRAKAMAEEVNGA